MLDEMNECSELDSERVDDRSQVLCVSSDGDCEWEAKKRAGWVWGRHRVLVLSCIIAQHLAVDGAKPWKLIRCRTSSVF